MRDRETKRDRAIGRVEATATFIKDLEGKLNELYPFVSGQNEPNYVGYVNREFPFCSFSIDQKPKDYQRKILSMALVRASDREDRAYSFHASEHETFLEATSRLIGGIKEGDITFQVSRKFMEFDTDKGKINIATNRLVLDSYEYDRISFIPHPSNYADDLKIKAKNITDREGRGKFTSNKLRKAAFEEGQAFGILVGFYLGLDERGIIEAFDNKEFRSKMKVNKQPFLYPGDPQHKILLTNLANILIATDNGPRVRTTPDPFINSLTALVNYGMLKEKEREQPRFQFIETKTVAKARVVFNGMIEFAHQVADPNYVEPLRSTEIDDRYHNKFSSKVTTAFIITKS